MITGNHSERSPRIEHVNAATHYLAKARDFAHLRTAGLSDLQAKTLIESIEAVLTGTVAPDTAVSRLADAGFTDRQATAIIKVLCSPISEAA